MPSLSKEEIVTVGVLTEKGQNHCEIARTLARAFPTFPQPLLLLFSIERRIRSRRRRRTKPGS